MSNITLSIYERPPLEEELMDRESIAKLRIDRRLIGRRGWISKEDLEAAIEALPDSAGKIKPPEPEDGDEAPAEAVSTAV